MSGTFKTHTSLMRTVTQSERRNKIEKNRSEQNWKDTPDGVLERTRKAREEEGRSTEPDGTCMALPTQGAWDGGETEKLDRKEKVSEKQAGGEF